MPEEISDLSDFRTLPLVKHGMYFDYIHRLRALDPEIYDQTRDLEFGCESFLQKVREFREIVYKQIENMTLFAVIVEREKMKAVVARNNLRLAEMRRKSRIHSLKCQIRDRRMQLERLRVQHHFLLRHESEQNREHEEFCLDNKNSIQWQGHLPYYL